MNPSTWPTPTPHTMSASTWKGSNNLAERPSSEFKNGPTNTGKPPRHLSPLRLHNRRGSTSSFNVTPSGSFAMLDQCYWGLCSSDSELSTSFDSSSAKGHLSMKLSSAEWSPGPITSPRDAPSPCSLSPGLAGASFSFAPLSPPAPPSPTEERHCTPYRNSFLKKCTEILLQPRQVSVCCSPQTSKTSLPASCRVNEEVDQDAKELFEILCLSDDRSRSTTGSPPHDVLLKKSSSVPSLERSCSPGKSPRLPDSPSIAKAPEDQASPRATRLRFLFRRPKVVPATGSEV